MYEYARISFAGSFQCRLATDGDPTGASPTDPFGDYGPKAQGWTFCYKETKFDRIIRLSSPVDLRSAVVDPRTDTKVNKVEVWPPSGPPQPHPGAAFPTMAPVPADLLLGQTVWLGDAKFDTKAGGGGVTREALIDFDFRIGSVFQAAAVTTPQCQGITKAPDAWQKEYLSTKPKVIAAAASGTIDPTRKKVLAGGDTIDNLASFFQFYDPIATTKLNQVRILNHGGVLAGLGDGTDHVWTLDLAFFRFDGDTLTGQCEGSVSARLDQKTKGGGK